MAASFGQMNQEISIDMMYAILYSISNHTVGSPKTSYGSKDLYGPDLYMCDFKQNYQDYDFKNKNTTKIDYIMMMGSDTQ